jgi:hypothetical protein
VNWFSEETGTGLDAGRWPWEAGPSTFILLHTVAFKRQGGLGEDGDQPKR